MTKALIIGLDGAVPSLIERFVNEGNLPIFNKLMNNGVYAPNCLGPFPPITPQSWTTVATGATIGTHGVYYWPKPMSSHTSRAEFIWEAVDRMGGRSILINYPCSWPPTAKKVLQIWGYGLGVGLVGGEKQYGPLIISPDHLFTTKPEKYFLSTQIALEQSRAQSNIPKSHLPPLEGTLRFERSKGSSFQLRIFIIASDKFGYDRCVIFHKNLLANLKVGDWSDWLHFTFQVEGTSRRGAFRLKLLELSPDGKILRLWATHIAPERGWSYPEDISSELVKKFGPILPTTGGPFRACYMKWIEPETYLEVLEWENAWFANTARHLMQKGEWNLFVMHAHTPDAINHLWIDQAQNSKRHLSYMLRAYKSLDSMIGKILEAAGADSLVFVVSDHGGIPFIEEPGKHRYNFYINSAIEEAGLKGKVEIRMDGIRFKIKGRDPDGVIPSEDYEEAQDRLIAALYNQRDSKGRRPVSFALRRKDARYLGLYGNEIADIIVAVDVLYAGGAHGPVLSPGMHGIGAMAPFFLMAGSGVKKGVKLERTVRLEDIVPTLCYLTGFPMPRQAEGAVIYQALEN